MLHELIKKRRSTVLFDAGKRIDQGIMTLLFEAARWAPSSLNLQPWRFIYALRGEANFQDLFECLIGANKEWAGNASMLLVTVAQNISDYKARKNMYAWHDTGMAYANLVFQATEMGLSVHPMGGFDRRKVVEVAGIPEGFEPVIFSAVGYKAEEGVFSGKLISRENSERIRKPVNEFVFEGRFGKEGNIQPLTT